MRLQRFLTAQQFSYKYNADGLRTEKKVGDKVISYTLVGSKITGQTDGTNTFYFRYDEGDNLLGFELGSEQYFYITNLVGDVIAIVDSNGETLVKYEYDPWGKCTIVSDTSENNLGTLNPFRYVTIMMKKQDSIIYKAVTMTAIFASSSILMIRAFCLKTTTTKILY